MSQHSLFIRSRFQLALAYSSSMGAILLLCGYVVHIAIAQAFTRTIDRELQVFAAVFDDKFQVLLKTPEKLPPTTENVLPGICLTQQTCSPMSAESDLFRLLEQGYYLRFLNLSGQAIAAVGANPDQFPDNPSLDRSYDIRDRSGQLYHLHLMPLYTQTGQLWGYLQIGRSLQRLNDYMSSLHWLLGLGVPTAMLLIGGAGWILAGLAIKPIQKSYQQIQQFTADAAHELRTPIAATQSIVETALDHPLFTGEAHQQTLQALQRQVKRLGDLTQDLLLLSRLENSTLSPQIDRICLNDLVTDVEEELMPRAIASQIHLSSEIQTQELVYLPGNEAQIYRLLINLVNNALQYTPAKGAVAIVLQVEHNQIAIAVKDTGIGIANPDLPRIFERFYRVNADRSRYTGGSGLGLAIAQAIVQAHQGRLQVESSLGKGSKFTVIFPLLSL